MADTHQNTPAYPDATANTAPVAEDTYTNSESVVVRRQVVRTQKVDGDDPTMGSKADSASTDTTSAWSLIALLKGLINTVASTALTRSSIAGSASTTANADNTYTFGAYTPLFYVQNNTGVPIYVNFDAAATLGSTSIAAGAMTWFQTPTTALHIYTTAITSVNGTTIGGIVIVGYH